MVLQWIFVPETFSLNLVETTDQTRFQIFKRKTKTKTNAWLTKETKAMVVAKRDNGQEVVSNLYYFQDKDDDKGKDNDNDKHKTNERQPPTRGFKSL